MSTARTTPAQNPRGRTRTSVLPPFEVPCIFVKVNSLSTKSIILPEPPRPCQFVPSPGSLPQYRAPGRRGIVGKRTYRGARARETEAPCLKPQSGGKPPHSKWTVARSYGVRELAPALPYRRSNAKSQVNLEHSLVEYFHAGNEQLFKEMLGDILQGRPQTVGEIASAALFLVRINPNRLLGRL